MRQTSRAVALLLTLESAQAVERTPTANVPVPSVGLSLSTTAFNPDESSAGAPTGSQALNSRQAGYQNIPNNASTIFTTQVANSKWLDATPQKAVIGTSNILTTYVVGSGCMQCIAGKGVWCSRTYSYLSSATSSPYYQYQVTTYAGGSFGTLVTSGDTAMTGGAKNDQGSCCETATLFSSFIGTKSVPKVTYTAPTDTTSQAAAGLTLIGNSCPAIGGGAFTAATAGNTDQKWADDAAVDASLTIWSSWWCSNGLYKRVTVNALTNTIELNAQQIIPQATNKRMELAQVGCPQVAAFCANVGNSIVFELTTLAPTKSYDMPLANTNNFSVTDKCTWVVTAVTAAPTFTMKNSSLGTTMGLLSANWEIHTMEYTAASSWSDSTQSLVNSPASSAGLILAASGLSRDSLLPLFTMPAQQFATLRTWYGVGTTAKDDVTQMPKAWMSAGQAAVVNTGPISTQLAAVKSQLYGNVANVPVSGNVENTNTDPLTATQNYGKVSSLVFDLRAMRYFPAMVAQTVWTAGSGLSTQYSTALASYKTAKTTWDAYVAILEKNAKQDAFAALFSPPKAPTVPPLPNMPWQPANYSGYQRATAAQVTAYSASGTNPTSVASPTAQEFWTSLAAAQVNGGWGSFTAQIFYFRNGFGKSFGTIGYSGDSDREKMSDAWKASWTCAASSATAQPTTQCEVSYTSTAGQVAVAGLATAQNTTKMITAVSLWSTANGNALSAATTVYGWGVNGFQITFNGSAWNSGIVGLKPLPNNEVPVVAKSLSGIAGAQALAATSAAALAVAAALY